MRKALAYIRKMGVVRESRLKKFLKLNNDEFNRVMCQLIDTGKIYVSYLNNEPLIMYVGG